MKDKIIVVAALLMLSVFSSSLYADRHHHHGKGFPHGLQKKWGRGEDLPPGWKRKHSRHDYGSEEPYYGGYGEPYYGGYDDRNYGRSVDRYYRGNDDRYYGSYNESNYGGYDDQYYVDDQPATVQDHVGRIIQDVIDLTGSLQ